MSGKLPAVFISSPFFGLQEVRTELARFFENDLGYRVLLFEDAHFPVEPDTDTIENCRRRVELDADVFVLILGLRYGYVPASGSLSVTHIEYLAARAKGIPIYAFVHRDALALLEGDSSTTPPSSEVADLEPLKAFITRVRSEDAVWSFAFEQPSEICAVLRIQLAYQMTRGLQIQHAMHGTSPALRQLSGPALRLAVDKPVGWQGFLLAEVAIACTEALDEELRAYRANLVFGHGESVLDADMVHWMNGRLADGRRYASSLGEMLNGVLNKCARSDDPLEVIGNGKLIGVALRDLVEWAQHIRRMHVPEDWTEVRDALSLMLDDVITKVAVFGTGLRDAIQAELAREDGPEHRTVVFEVVLTLSNDEAFAAALDSLKRRRSFPDGLFS